MPGAADATFRQLAGTPLLDEYENSKRCILDDPGLLVLFLAAKITLGLSDSLDQSDVNVTYSETSQILIGHGKSHMINGAAEPVISTRTSFCE